MSSSSAIFPRVFTTLFLAACSVGLIAAENPVQKDISPCGAFAEGELKTIQWRNCTPDEKLSIAMGMMLSDEFVEKYAPVSIDSKLLKFGFDHFESVGKIPIDMHEARQILKGIRPPTNPGERYAWSLYRLLGCTDTEEKVIVRPLKITAGQDSDPKNDKQGKCLEAFDFNDEKAESKFDEGSKLTIRYRRDTIGRYEYRTPPAETIPACLDPDDVEKETFAIKKMISGWQTVVQELTPGVEYEVVIPPGQGYGERGVADTVEPGEYLRFVMLLESDDMDPNMQESCGEAPPKLKADGQDTPESTKS